MLRMVKMMVNLGLFNVNFYFPNGKSTMTGESIVFFFWGGDPLSKSNLMMVNDG